MLRYIKQLKTYIFFRKKYKFIKNILIMMLEIYDITINTNVMYVRILWTNYIYSLIPYIIIIIYK